MVETLLDREAEWISGSGTEADVAVYTCCELYRNLADFPFPGQCTDDEKSAIEDRIVGLLDTLNLTASGRYWSFQELDARERQFLAERKLTRFEFLKVEGARGVYIADDQSLSICINDENHLTIRGLASGMQIQEVWSRMSLLDDTLAGALDFAFSDRLGYLTAAIDQVGTGFRATTCIHLPALEATKLIGTARDMARDKRHHLEDVTAPEAITPGDLHGERGSALGDLYTLSNSSTLGRSEEETCFHLKHVTSDLIEREREARRRIQADAPLQLEDRVGRALGQARGVRLVAFHEANSILSSLRLGVSSGLLDQFSLRRINGVWVASQNAHIEMKCGHDCDELTLSAERADLFRSRFA